MLKSYFTIAIRNLLRHQFYTFLNVIGLAIGVGCLIVAILYYDYHNQFNAGHIKEDRIYRVLSHLKDVEGTRYLTGTHPVAPHIKAAFPEVEAATRIINRQMWVDAGADAFHEYVAIVDTSYTHMFTLQMAQGDARTGLLQPNTCFIDESLAKRLFGSDDPIGKTISVNYKWVEGDYTVTGVMKNIADKTLQRLKFSFLTTTFSTPEHWKEPVWEHWPSDWFVTPLGTYILLREGTDPAHFQALLDAFSVKHKIPDARQQISYVLQPFSEIHLYTQRNFGIPQGEDIDRVDAILGIGVLVLFLACLNYINLVTAQSPLRSREVGLRKVSGALQGHLMCQFLGESTLVVTAAFAVAVGLASLMLPSVSDLLGVPLELNGTSAAVLVALPLIIIPAVGTLAGAYPAFVLSSAAPAIAVQGGSSVGRRSWFRTVLVVFQLGVSGILLVCTLVVNDQIEFIRNKDLGFHTDGLVEMPMIIRAPDRSVIFNQTGAIRTELMKIPGVEGVTFTLIHPWRVSDVNWTNLTPEGGQSHHKIHNSGIDDFYFEVLDIPILSGRLPTSDGPRWRELGENEVESDIIINEAAARVLGWGKDAVDKRAFRDVKSRDGREIRLWSRVACVVGDSHNQSLHLGIAPSMYSPGGSLHYTLVRLGPGNLVDQMAGLEAVWGKFLEGKPFEFNFADDLMAEAYASELQLRSVFGFFSSLSIFVGCLGILGLVTFTAQQRTKEIGIRKVLGASNQGVLVLLSSSFLKLAALSFVIGFPVAYYLAESWLTNFTFRIDIGVGIFALVATATLALVALTVGFQSWRAASADPVRSIRHE
jgi:putative ABC transport system permease protein